MVDEIKITAKDLSQEVINFRGFWFKDIFILPRGAYVDVNDWYENLLDTIAEIGSQYVKLFIRCRFNTDLFFVMLKRIDSEKYTVENCLDWLDYIKNSNTLTEILNLGEFVKQSYEKERPLCSE